ncbi:uncharacterized protein LOC143877676 isoform X1 [Tasmannia lanceolata]|uniref:uncharacterized protein LOC143877676 isoform X1 n=1 Tax=Tasmannia lanceolata TaxID=3420 RepID=UPI00406281DD
MTWKRLFRDFSPSHFRYTDYRKTYFLSSFRDRSCVWRKKKTQTTSSSPSSPRLRPRLISDLAHGNHPTVDFLPNLLEVSFPSLSFLPHQYLSLHFRFLSFPYERTEHYSLYPKDSKYKNHSKTKLQKEETIKTKESFISQMASMTGADSQSAVAFMELALVQVFYKFSYQIRSSTLMLSLPWTTEKSRSALNFFTSCVIVEEGKVISSGCNRTTESRNATRHAEMEAIDVLLEQWLRNGLSHLDVAEKFSRCDIYVTCEPCIMCATALSILGIRAVYYGCASDKFGGCGSILSLHTSSSEQFPSKVFQGKGFKCTGGIMALEAVSLLRRMLQSLIDQFGSLNDKRSTEGSISFMGNSAFIKG